mgnify:CR=1 FL=1
MYETHIESQPGVKLWCPDKAGQFCDNIILSDVKTIEHSLNELSCNIPTAREADLTKIAKDISNIFINAAQESFGLKKNLPPKHNACNFNKPWFNKDCRTARKKYHLAKKKKYTIYIKRSKTKSIWYK